MPISDEETAIYLTENAGHTLFFVSELAAIGSLSSITGESDPGESFKAVVSEVVKVAGLYSDYLLAAVNALLGDDLVNKMAYEPVQRQNQPSATNEIIMFFELPRVD